MTVWQVMALLEAKRAAVCAELEELRREGAGIIVPDDATFLCKLLGLVVNLETGQIEGWVDERYAVYPNDQALEETNSNNQTGELTPSKPRALIYARSASANAGRIESQLALCRQVATTHEWQIVEVCREYAGTVLAERPQLERALQLAHAGAYDVMIVADPSRLAHHVSQQRELAQPFAEIGIKDRLCIG